MSLESFNRMLNKSKFYYFKTLKDFDKKIDWNGTHLKNIKFERGVVDDREYSPYLWKAYGTKV